MTPFVMTLVASMLLRRLYKNEYKCIKIGHKKKMTKVCICFHFIEKYFIEFFMFTRIAVKIGSIFVLVLNSPNSLDC